MLHLVHYSVTGGLSHPLDNSLANTFSLSCLCFCCCLVAVRICYHCMSCVILPLFTALTLFQMFEDWFSSSGADGSGLSSEPAFDLGYDFSSGLSHGSGFDSGSGPDFGSAWGSGEVLPPCLLGKTSKQ